MLCTMSMQIPTTVSDEKVQEFKELYLKHFDIELSDKEAYEKGLHLLQFMATILDISGAYFVEKQ